MNGDDPNVVGIRVADFDTPALWVDLDLMEENIRRLSAFFKAAGVAWRPHTKGIKIPAVASRLIEAGAIGITCAKLGEAEVMAAGGIRDILIANQVVGDQKVARLAELRELADVIVAVDDLGNARQVSQAAVDRGVKIRVIIEVNSGMNRSGLEPGPGVVDFARQLCSLPGILFSGLMAWEGHVVSLQDPVEKKMKAEMAVNSLVQSAELCRQAGLEVAIVSCGGTGSFRISAHIPGVTEIQAGGGVFGDLTYNRKYGAGLECSLYVLATVISHPVQERAVLNAGRKAINGEYSLPEVKDLPGVQVARLSAEHAILRLEPHAPEIHVGDKVNLIVGYEDLTVFLHDRLFGARNGKVEVVWDILGRGKLS